MVRSFLDDGSVAGPCARSRTHKKPPSHQGTEARPSRSAVPPSLEPAHAQPSLRTYGFPGSALLAEDRVTDTPLPITGEKPVPPTEVALAALFGTRLPDPFRARQAPGSHLPRLALPDVSGTYSFQSSPLILFNWSGLYQQRACLSSAALLKPRAQNQRVGRFTALADRGSKHGDSAREGNDAPDSRSQGCSVWQVGQR
jgi:hypothetical protein